MNNLEFVFFSGIVMQIILLLAMYIPMEFWICIWLSYLLIGFLIALCLDVLLEEKE